MGCCEYKNLSRKFSENGEISPTDSVSRISEKYGNAPENEPNKKQASSLSLKLEKIQCNSEEKKYIEVQSDYYNVKKKSLFLPLSIQTNEKESSLIRNLRIERLKVMSPSKRLNMNGSLAEQSPSCKMFPFMSNLSAFGSNNNNNFNWGTGNSALLEEASPSAKLFPFMFQPSDLVTLKLNSIYDDYQIGKILGEGGFSKVFEVIDKKTHIKRALKCIKKLNQKNFSEKVLKEVRILKTLDHPNMVRIIDFYETPDEFQIVTDLCTGGELFYKIAESQHFDEIMACSLMRQILSCLEYCHRQNIVHLDIKPENLIFETPEPGSLLKLIDFGTSTFYDHNEQMTVKIGTPAYMAPEVIKSNYNEKCDVWSCGVILYVLLSGMLPFEGDSETEIQHSVLNSEVSFADEEWVFVSADAKAFIRRLLDKNPTTRYSATEALKDPWMIRFGNKKSFETFNMQKTLNNLKTYKNTKQFQNVVWTVIAQYLVSKKEQEEILTTFRLLDSNEDGRLSREELIAGFQNIYGGNMEKAIKEVDRIMRHVDLNKNNCIDYSEFLLATLNREDFLTDEKLETVFNIIDKDKTGKISFDTIKNLFHECDKNVPSEFWKKLLDEFSRYENGYVRFFLFSFNLCKAGSFKLQTVYEAKY